MNDDMPSGKEMERLADLDEADTQRVLDAQRKRERPPQQQEAGENAEPK